MSTKEQEIRIGLLYRLIKSLREEIRVFARLELLPNDKGLELALYLSNGRLAPIGVAQWIRTSLMESGDFPVLKLELGEKQWREWLTKDMLRRINARREEFERYMEHVRTRGELERLPAVLQGVCIYDVDRTADGRLLVNHASYPAPLKIERSGKCADLLK